MSGNKEFFTNLDRSVQSKVKLGDDNKVPVNGKGMTNVFSKNGDKKHINDVYFVPGLKCNLISIGQLMEKGYKVIFNHDMCTIFDKYHRKRLVVRVKMAKNRMFPLNMKSEIQNFMNSRLLLSCS